jgi:hypothetical protein
MEKKTRGDVYLNIKLDENTIKTRLGAPELLVWESDAQNGSMFLFHLKEAVKRSFSVRENVGINLIVTQVCPCIFSGFYGGIEV